VRKKEEGGRGGEWMRKRKLRGVDGKLEGGGRRNEVGGVWDARRRVGSREGRAGEVVTEGGGEGSLYKNSREGGG